MPITVTSGNLLTQDVDALVNTVNTVGVMGKGIALQFKRAWPEMFTAYAVACERGEVQPGRMHVWETGALTGPRFIINFPTKRHWKDRSRLEDVRSGLTDLVRVVDEHGITSIAVPPLGCGNGGLAWRDVEPLIAGALSPVADRVDVRVFAPAGAPPAAEQVHRERAPQLTPGRAALLALMSFYEQLTFEPPTPVEVQKLAYFLQNAGEPLRLHFVQHRYGPYADDLRKSLRAMEGHYISGFGDGSARVDEAEPIRVRPETAPVLADYLAEHPETERRIHEVLAAIEGFESTYGLELLATVHWLLQHDEAAAGSWGDAHAKVRAWSPRKASLFTPPHVETAWRAVKERHLVPTG
ncbi:type II toxin-antitoxin system antitoxin DNA ADP-ribosyl glycohydrolase DarG [Kineococcus sp. G2]|uniref:type II toxin-antitoxin system antitoxin DNA ADP-ribosyl glycohydrolase DarG n=1 Tax=Kineococcus sp. G2 TaxID=3127484 RepID=UPI00301CCD77